MDVEKLKLDTVYWVKLKPYMRKTKEPPCQELVTPDWEPMLLSKGNHGQRRFHRLGVIRWFKAEEVQEIGHEVRKTDSEARSLLRSVMIELEEFHNHDGHEADYGKPMYGPFSDCHIMEDPGVYIGWGNLAYFEEKYAEFKEKEAADG